MAPKSPKIFITFSDTLMLCSKFELILTSIFQVTVIFKNEPKSEKIPYFGSILEQLLKNHKKSKLDRNELKLSTQHKDMYMYQEKI